MLSSILNMNGESSWSSKFCHCCGNALENGYNYCPKCGQEVLTRGDKSPVAHDSHLNGNRTVENHVGAATTRVHAPSNKESA
jgi:predicted amidophosphoribosyltransferase